MNKICEENIRNYKHLKIIVPLYMIHALTNSNFYKITSEIKVFMRSIHKLLHLKNSQSNQIENFSN